MPTDPFSAIIYVLLLVPGIVYTRQSELRKSAGKLSAFRETAIVVISSSFALFLTWLTVVIFSWIPAVSSWLSMMIRDPELVRSENPLKYSGVLFGLLIVASLYAYIMALPSVSKFLNKVSRRDGDARIGESAWGIVFDAPRGTTVIATVEFDSGDWMQGPISSWNHSPDETENRSLVLEGPILLRRTDETNATLMNQEQSIVIGAGVIRYLSAMQDPTDMWLTHYRRQLRETVDAQNENGS